jgi:hypothetical protein
MKSMIRPVIIFSMLMLAAAISRAQEIKAIRLNVNPIIRPEMLPEGDGSNINGPSLLKVPDWIKSPLGKYYLYFAHHQGKYIRLAYADKPEGPWKIYEKGTLRCEDCVYDDGTQKLTLNHLASPDVHIDQVRKEVVMYFHISPHNPGGSGTSQVTLRSVSKDGINFKSENVILGESYFRVFQWDGQFYAFARSGNIYRSKNGTTRFEKGQNPFAKTQHSVSGDEIRHVALLQVKNAMYVFYSRIGDAPEHIEYSQILLNKDWSSWEASAPVSLLEPAEDYEGVNEPIVKSVTGASKKPVRQLRDPAIYQENDKIYLLYSVAGELGIAMAELKFNASK